ncbi:MAG: sugar ABC transporter ATP-binding protein [Candidatus Brocadiae bacterium]|nr:sugar ABC transporter ATP-binding protein [Candidatus Brocadiia bacterium]
MALLELQDVSKSYSGVLALQGVCLSVERGEVHALVGENGAGKSTLIKIVAGAIQADEGAVWVDGSKVRLHGPSHSQALGISVIHQELNLLPQMSVAENLFLAREPRRKVCRLLDWPRLRRMAREALATVGLSIDPATRVARLSIAEKQLVEIAKALTLDARIILMDEPSATLTERELGRLFRIIGDLKQRGVAVLYISHRLEEVFEIADRVTVIRDGQWIDTQPVDCLDRRSLIHRMVGREMEEEFPPRKARRGGELLRVDGLCVPGRVHDASFCVRSGEVVGLGGLVGAGRTELARAVFGADPRSAGRISIEGREARVASCAEAIRLGMALLTEDRKEQGLHLGRGIHQNISLVNLKELVSFGLLRLVEERRVAGRYVRELSIRTPSVTQQVRNLSGGNQQKVVLAKWLYSKARIFLFDEPTRGIDVGTKYEIYLLLNRLAEAGMGVMIISSELPELIGLCDRVLIMADGRIVGEVSGEGMTQEAIMELATSGRSRAVEAG